MHYLVKLTYQRDQYRITIPKDLVRKLNLGAVEVMKLTEWPKGKIIIEEYDGKDKGGE